ncbi:TRAP transporter small permease subunit [Maritimibacter sp. DP07]|uniref:TRAP transporter small permease protein n=1 Tax=Maritimibacter harenae TaxID=2606218 RepID=A0A845LZG8_9RHOB|nr:TRAP transporter small permease [Maritimibacter harenae]MZR12179.1 TRAP transporter small permease subunit [Maritimibacter harenae]
MKTSWIDRIAWGADNALIAIASLGLVAMMLHISGDIIASLLFNAPIATTSAIVTNYYMIAVAFLPIYAAEFRDAHIGVNLLTARLPNAVQRWLEVLIMIATAGVYVLLAAQSWEQATQKLETTAYVVEQTSKIFIWPSYFMLPAAFAAVALLLVVKVLSRIAGGPVLREPVEAGKERDDV